MLAGGHGTRLHPITSWLNKHLYPITYNGKAKPVIDFALEALKEAGITEVGIVLGDFRCEDIFSYLKDGSERGMKFSYFWQGEPLGIAHAVTCAKDFVKGHNKFLVYLGDNFFSNGISEFAKECNLRSYISYDSMYQDVGVLFAKTKTPERFGCPKFKNKYKRTLLKVEEKPKNPQSNLAISGCYCFNDKTFFEEFKRLKPSSRGEYELTDMINNFIKYDPKSVFWQIYDGFWSDMGTFESIMEVQKWLEEEK